MKGLSKSRYTAFYQCPKNLWLKVFKPEEATIDAGVEARFEQGNMVGDLAMGLFGEYKEAHAEKLDGSLDLAAMVEQTQQWIQQGVENICEASFALEGHYCAVDVLRKNGGEAMTIYPKIAKMSQAEADAARQSLLEYCELDTWAMVKVWEKLKEMAE